MPNVMTLADVRTICGIVSLVEDFKLQPWLNEAEVRLEKILGRTGMGLLRTAKAADPTFALAGSADWLALKEHFEAFLAWQTYHLSLPGMHSQPTRNGFHAKGGTEGGETYTAIDQKTLAMHETGIRTTLENRQDRLIDACARGNYAWYGTTVAGEERIERTAFVGISFRKHRQQFREGIPDKSRTT